MDTKERSQLPQQKVMKYFSIIMSLVYFGLGTFLLTAGDGSFQIPYKQRLLLGLLFIGYGLFRTYRLYVVYYKPARNKDVT